MNVLLGVQLFMKVEFDKSKRDKTLTERGLDFEFAGEVFDGVHLTARDTRKRMKKFDSSAWGTLLDDWLYWFGRHAAMSVASSV
jgi:uncharacterized DUF497 family protein